MVSNLIRRFVFHTLVFLSLFACSTGERVPSEFVHPGSDLSATSPTATPIASLNDGSPLYKYSEEFDKWLKGSLPTENAHSLFTHCRSGSENPYCPSILKQKSLLKIRDLRQRTRTPIEIRPVIPIKPEVDGATIKNWSELRKSQVPQLLKGFLASSSQELNLMKAKALKETRCPNNAAIALAATLEDFLPTDADPKDIASLYLQGARCARRQPIDLEHFQTRAALFFITQNQTKRASEILAKVKPTDAFSGRAAYWLYKSFLALGDKPKADKAFDRLVKIHPFSFHALLAWKEKHFDPGKDILEDRAFFEKRSKRSQKLNLVLSQIESLKKYGFDYSASILVEYGLEFPRIEPGVKTYLASLGEPRTKINTGSEFLFRRSSGLCRPILELAYPKAFYPLFLKYGSSSISPYLAMSIARRESSFDPMAISPANAQGLLQLNPDTFLKNGSGKAKDLLEPALNIELGTNYLYELSHKRFSNVYLAIAAYNAGEVSVETWMKRYPKSDPVLFTDLIPYRETRDYVANVLTNYYWYRRIYEGPQAAEDLML